MIALKSCPFCGSDEIHTYEPTAYEIGNNASVNCENPICGAEVRGRTLKEAIAKWNRRVRDNIEELRQSAPIPLSYEQMERYYYGNVRSFDINTERKE